MKKILILTLLTLLCSQTITLSQGKDMEKKMLLLDDFRLIASAKGLELVRSFYGIDKNLQAVKSGDSLGQGRELLFQEIPNVHWPETIATFSTSVGRAIDKLAGAPKEKDLEVLRERGRAFSVAVKEMCYGNATAQAGEEIQVAIARR